MPSPRLWIALTRPDNLVVALAVAVAARKQFGSVHLIREQSSWWEHAHWEEYRHLLAGVHLMAKVSPVRGLLDSARYVRDMRRRQATLAALGIDGRDIILALGSTTNLANALASAYPQVPKVLCLPAKIYADATRPADTPGYRSTTSGWLQYWFLDLVAGVGRTVRRKHRHFTGDGARLERLRQELSAVFQALVLFHNDRTAQAPAAGARVFAAPFVGRADLTSLAPRASGKKDPQGRRNVIFFGTPFLLVRNIDPHLYAATLNGCLDYLRHHFRATCRLIYRPHPAETSERRLLRLRGFIPQDDLEVAELYLLKNMDRIDAVFSVASTVSRVALNYGLHGYAFWRCFPFAPPATTFFESLLDEVPAGFEIASLDEPPKPYAIGRAEDSKSTAFVDAIRSALAAARAAIPVPVAKEFARAEDSPV